MKLNLFVDVYITKGTLCSWYVTPPRTEVENNQITKVDLQIDNSEFRQWQVTFQSEHHELVPKFTKIPSPKHFKVF